jgi:putative sigma-54 modulation protein
MQINITGHHVDITPALRAYVEEKLERLERHFDNITNTHVILEIEKDRQKAEATINVSRGRVYADSENENMYAAIDSLVDKLDRQIKKHKEKLKDHHRGEGLKNQEAV